MIRHLENTALIQQWVSSPMEGLERGTSSSSAGNDAQGLRKACQQFEEFFIYYLLKVMRQSVPKADLLDDSKGEEVYQSLMDQEMARKLASSGGIGLSALLLDRLSTDALERPQEAPEKTGIGIGREKPSFMLPLQGDLTSPYGMRTDPFTGAQAFHRGIDLAAREGTPVRCSGSGRVIESSAVRGYGNYVKIAHGDGYTTLYAHLLDRRVSVGEQVTEGDIIGRVGQTGRSTGPHLHFEVQKDDEHVDPSAVIRTSLAFNSGERGML